VSGSAQDKVATLIIRLQSLTTDFQARALAGRAPRSELRLSGDRSELIGLLANDSNEGKNQSEFLLVIRPHQAVAELMAECPTCGAMTSFALELAWRLGAVSCSECHLLMRLVDDDITALRERLIEARMRIDGLAAR
jgi:hypothetical protein